MMINPQQALCAPGEGECSAKMRRYGRNSGGRDVVHASPGKRMAAQQPSQGKPAATQQAVAFDGNIGVFRACWQVFAASGEGAGEVQKRRKESFVDQKTTVEHGAIRGGAQGL